MVCKRRHRLAPRVRSRGHVAVAGRRVQAVSLFVWFADVDARLRCKRSELSEGALKMTHGGLAVVSSLGPDLGSGSHVECPEEPAHDAETLRPKGLNEGIATEAHQHPGACRRLHHLQTLGGALLPREIEQRGRTGRRSQHLRGQYGIPCSPWEGNDLTCHGGQHLTVDRAQRLSLLTVSVDDATVLEALLGGSHDKIMGIG
mmetsp:Transcript_29370/g.77628  ORF Transcript_29370/g.77628 Transcript_29370/m.77628 type:complete len:202 (-) Transcript_29370:970-1575(-)